MFSISINRSIDRNVLHKAFNIVKLAVSIFSQVLNQPIQRTKRLPCGLATPFISEWEMQLPHGSCVGQSPPVLLSK